MVNELVNSIINSPRVQELSKLRYEVFLVLYICPNSIKGNPNYDSIGTKDNVYFPAINSVISSCQDLNTSSIVLLHNHPYYRGVDTFFRKKCNPEPSDIDINSTKTFIGIIEPCGVNVLDHIVVCPDGSYFSFKQSGLM